MSPEHEKAKKIKRITPFQGVDFLLDYAMGKKKIDRSEAMRDEFDDIVVDTMCATDTGKWETAIHRQGMWVVVEQYASKRGATSGHKAWTGKLKASPSCELKDINLWGLHEGEDNGLN